MTQWPGTNLAFLIRTAWKFADHRRRHMVAFYVMFILANTLLSLQPAALAKVIDAAQKGGEHALWDVLLWAGLYGSITLLFWVFHGPARIIERRTAFYVSRNFIDRMYRVVTELPLRWHQDHHSGNTINRIRKAERSLFQFADHQFIILEILVRFVSCTAMLFVFSTWVAVASFVSSLAILLLIRAFDARLSPLARARNEAEHVMSGALYDYIGNIITVLTLRMQGNTGDEVRARYDNIRNPFWRQINLNEWKWAWLNLLLILTQVLILGGYLYQNMRDGQIVALGGAVAIFQYLLMIMQQFFHASLFFGDLLYQSIDVRGVDPLLADHERLVDARKSVQKIDWKAISIRKLNFSHGLTDEEKASSLSDVSFDIQAGDKIALVGNSGSGKTTLLTLLRGLYDAESVDLSVDGQSFKHLAPLAGFTTLLPQDSEIFENTVLYNLTLGTQIPDSQIQLALSVSAFDEVVPVLPNGLQTDIRERGVNLSGGQKQRLALARGLLAARSSSLILMDEPTSSLDPLTENKVFDRLFKSCNGKTLVVSLHRLHLLPRFDKIILMQDGRIVEQGSFTELLASQGAFSRLWLTHLSQVELT